MSPLIPSQFRLFLVFVISRWLFFLYLCFVNFVVLPFGCPPNLQHLFANSETDLCCSELYFLQATSGCFSFPFWPKLAIPVNISVALRLTFYLAKPKIPWKRWYSFDVVFDFSIKFLKADFNLLLEITLHTLSCKGSFQT